MKLNPRLAMLERMVGDHYQHIWDCCCDHGLLGMHLLQRLPAARIHFVDQVPTLMAKLAQTLAQFFPPEAGPQRWQLHTGDVAAVQLAPGDQPQLVIIAGVGGDLTLELVTALCDAHPGQSLEFLLCPVRQQYLLRRTLAARGLSLLDERLVEERGRFYEVIHLTTATARPLSPVGSLLWQEATPAHQRYLARLLKHYERLQGSQPQLAQAALAALAALADYRQLNITGESMGATRGSG